MPEPNDVTILEAIQNAVEFLEALGYKSGDIHDDLHLAATRLRSKHPAAAKDVLG